MKQEARVVGSRTRYAALALGGVMALAGCGGASSDAGGDDADRVIGVASAKTGWMATYDDPIFNAAKLAVEKHNADGGVLGRKLKLATLVLRPQGLMGAKELSVAALRRRTVPPPDSCVPITSSSAR